MPVENIFGKSEVQFLMNDLLKEKETLTDLEMPTHSDRPNFFHSRKLEPSLTLLRIAPRPHQSRLGTAGSLLCQRFAILETYSG